MESITAISKKILKLAKGDRMIRSIFMHDKSEKIVDEMHLIDTHNREEFKKIFKKVGYINSKYGKKVQFGAFLLVQHMPRNEIEFMKKYLALMKKDLEGVDLNNFAQLCDRVETLQNKPQIYGTQFMPVEGKNNTYVLKELVDPSKVDRRRASIGLEPLKTYMDRISMERGVTLLM